MPLSDFFTYMDQELNDADNPEAVSSGGPQDPGAPEYPEVRQTKVMQVLSPGCTYGG